MKQSLSRPLILFIGLSLFVFQSCKAQANKVTYEARIEKVLGHYLYLRNGDTLKIISLLGAYIPLPWDENYREDLQTNVRQLVEGKTVKVETVVKAHAWGYPKHDQVKIYIDKTNLNRYLLIEGTAFFNEDYWDKKEKEEYRQLEDLAKKNMKGIWKNIDKLKILSVRRKDWQYTHAPGCPHTQNLPDEELIKYYVPLSFQKEAIVEEVTCEFSVKIWREQEKKRKSRKEKYQFN